MAQAEQYSPSFWVFGYEHPKDLQLMKDLEFAGVGFSAAKGDGDHVTYHFDSPTLRQFPWATQSQDRPGLAEYATRAHAAGLKVMANMEGANPGRWEAGRRHWTPEITGSVMADLHNEGGDRWFTECVVEWPRLFNALADTGHEIGMEYQEGDDSYSLHHFDADTGKLNFVDVFPRGHLVTMYHYRYRRDEIGKQAALTQEGSLAYGFAHAWGLPTSLVFSVHHNWGESPEYWEGILKPSIAIRALQFRVDEFMLIGLDDERARQVDVPAMKRWIADLVSRNTQETRPLLNVVVHLRSGVEAQWRDCASSGDAITSGAFHAGWNIVASTEPLPTADGYYVYTTGRDEEGTLDLTPEIASLFAGKKPVFLQVGFDIPTGGDLTPNWRQSLSACGVDPDAALTYGDMPARGAYKGMPFTYTGILTAYELTERPHGTLIPRSAVTGRVTAEAEGVPLIASKGNKHLVPANCIRWQMMGPISDLLAGCGVRASSDVWGIAGEKVTVLLATHDTELDLVIPKLAKGARIRVTQWDRLHQLTREDTVSYTGSYEASMRQFDSILVEAL